MMHRFSSCAPQFCRVVTSRSICLTSSSFNKDLYRVLGLRPSATQGEIKGAYYKLSMKLHPDKNKNSETAADEFREVSDAYGVLGNIKLRKLYDRGVLHQMPQSTSSPDFRGQESPQPKQRRGFDDPPDPELKERFYTAYAKSRANRTSPSTSRSSNMYNFDEWTRLHYSSHFENDRDRTEYLNQKSRRQASYGTTANNICQMFAGVLLLVTFFQLASDVSFDTPRRHLDDSPPPRRT